MTRNSRARDPKAKEEKRQLILDTAWAFLEAKALTDISMAEIAKQAGMAKGTLYLYFKTREEIFIALLGQEIATWQAHIRQRLRQGVAVETLLETVIAFAVARPRFMMLATYSGLVLEHNISDACALGYKQAMKEETELTARALEQSYAELQAGHGAELLLQTYALAIGTWQTANPPQPILDLIEREKIELFQVDFEAMLRRGLNALWRGFLLKPK